MTLIVLNFECLQYHVAQGCGIKIMHPVLGELVYSRIELTNFNTLGIKNEFL